MRLNTTALSATALLASAANAALTNIPNNNRNQRITALAKNGDLLAISMRSGETTNATLFQRTNDNQWKAGEALATRIPSNATDATFMGNKAVITSTVEPDTGENRAHPWITVNSLDNNTLGLQLDASCGTNLEATCIERIITGSLTGSEYGSTITWEKDNFFTTTRGFGLITDRSFYAPPTNEDYQYAIVADGHILLDQTSGRRRLVVAEIPSGNDSLQVPEGTNVYPQGKLTCSTSFACIDSLEYDNNSNASEFKIHQSINASNRKEFFEISSYALQNYSINDQGFLTDDTHGTYIWFQVIDRNNFENRLVFAPYSPNDGINVNNAKYLTITEQPTKVFVQNFQHLGIETTSMAYTPLGPIDPNNLTSDTRMQMLGDSPRPTANPTTGTPTKAPTKQPTLTPTASPSKKPTPAPTPNPTGLPTNNPTNVPTTRLPTLAPTASPSGSPTTSPTITPTMKPTGFPTTLLPTQMPSSSPSITPTAQPTKTPTLPPTPQIPTLNARPTAMPTQNPSTQPTHKPSSSPNLISVQAPTSKPSSEPTNLRGSTAPSTSTTETNTNKTNGNEGLSREATIGLFAALGLVGMLTAANLVLNRRRQEGINDTIIEAIPVSESEASPASDAAIHQDAPSDATTLPLQTVKTTIDVEEIAIDDKSDVSSVTVTEITHSGTTVSSETMTRD